MGRGIDKNINASGAIQEDETPQQTYERRLDVHIAKLNSATTVYFPNLNGVRFIASFSVLIHHIEQVKTAFGLPNIYDNYFIKNMGKLGVGLFFTLSGFLITYLLLVEKKKTGQIKLRNFYIRRALRIWPLYLLIVILSFFVFPHLSLFYDGQPLNYFFDSNFYTRLFLFLFMLPNFGLILFGAPYLCSQTWSVGVEEQFYILWPLVIGSASFSRALRPIILYVAVIVAFSYLLIEANRNSLDPVVISKFFTQYLSQFRILTMVIGGAGSYLIFSKRVNLLSVLFRKKVQILIYTILFICLVIGVHIPYFNLEFYALFFCYFIMNVAANPDSIFNLEYRPVSYLGKVSYGTYMYHTAMTAFTINFLLKFSGLDSQSPAFTILIYLGAIALSFLVSGLSYAYFEKPFLRLKESFGQFSSNTVSTLK